MMPPTIKKWTRITTLSICCGIFAPSAFSQSLAQEGPLEQLAITTSGGNIEISAAHYSPTRSFWGYFDHLFGIFVLEFNPEIISVRQIGDLTWNLRDRQGNRLVLRGLKPSDPQSIKPDKNPFEVQFDVVGEKGFFSIETRESRDPDDPEQKGPEVDLSVPAPVKLF